MAKKPTPFVWGVTPNPRNWHQAADALRSNQTVPAKKDKKKSPLLDRLLGIEQLLKDKDHGIPRK